MLEQLYQLSLSKSENSVSHILKNQVLDQADMDFGGIRDRVLGLTDPSSSSSPLLRLVLIYCNEDSEFFQFEEIYRSIQLLLDYIERIQRPDGTFDLITTNFYSAPDSGFFLHNATAAYRIIENYCPERTKDSLLKRLKEIIRTTGYGIMNGGFHTPNHRWVVTASLLAASNICGISEFKNRAMNYLAEGIDCDEHGEYTEKSKGIYDIVNNKALMMIAEELHDDTLLEHVKRNLTMLYYFLEPNGSVFTNNSIRQDKGETFYPTSYYPLFLEMAYTFKDPMFAGMLKEIIDITEEHHLPAPNTLDLFMLKPELKTYNPHELLTPPRSYEQFYQKSGIVRAKKEDYSFSLLRDASQFLFFQVNNLRCQLKMCTSFFGKGQFKPSILRKEKDGSYYLMSTHEGFYRMPFEDPVSSSDWHKMDHTKRELVKRLKLTYHVHIKEIDDGIEVSVRTEGCTRVPFKFEMIVSPNTIISGDSFECRGTAGQSMNIKSGNVSIYDGNDGISIGPAFHSHSFTSTMRGSEPQNTNEYTLYFTDFTECDRTIQITKL